MQIFDDHKLGKDESSSKPASGIKSFVTSVFNKSLFKLAAFTTCLHPDEPTLQAKLKSQDDIIASLLSDMAELKAHDEELASTVIGLTLALQAEQQARQAAEEKAQEEQKAREVAEAKAAADTEAAGQDYLTKIPNVRGLTAKLGEEFDRAKREGTTFCVVLCDLNGFKKVNDDLGHMSGNVTLQEAARGFSQGLRSYDYVARMGGDEFVVLLPGLTLEEGEKLAQRMADRFDRHMRDAGYHVDGRFGHNITGCFGVSCSNEVGDIETSKTIEVLLAIADKRMYAEKENNKSLEHSSVHRTAPEIQAQPEPVAQPKPFLVHTSVDVYVSLVPERLTASSVNVRFGENMPATKPAAPPRNDPKPIPFAPRSPVLPRIKPRAYVAA